MCEYAQEGHDWKFKKEVSEQVSVEPGVYKTGFFGGTKVVTPEKVRVDTYNVFVCPCGEKKKVLESEGDLYENSWVGVGEWKKKKDV